MFPRAGLIVAVVALLGTGACSSAPKQRGNSPPPVVTVTVTMTAPASTAPRGASSSTTSVMGLVVNGTGATLTPPSAPTTKPLTSDCHNLTDAGFTSECLTVSGPGGTIAAMVETERQQNRQGGSVAGTEERDLVYRRTSSGYALALRRVTQTRQYGEQNTRLYESDIMRDGDPKAVFVATAPNPNYGDELDVVDENATVSLLRQLHGGFADIAAGGGLQTYVPSQAGYDSAVIRYGQGAWRIVTVATVSQTQAQAENQQPFYDPAGQVPGA